MVGNVVIAGIIVLCLLAAAVLIHVFVVPIRPLEEELKEFTVLVYRPEDKNFENKLIDILSQLRWTEPCFYSEIYIVHINVPDEQSEAVRKICSVRRNLIYISIDEFIKAISSDKNFLEMDCNLSK